MSAASVLERPTQGTLPEIDDLTRREFVAGVLATALLIACGGDEDEEEARASEREVVGMFGPVTIPARAQRVIADNNTTLGNMLALGVKPVGSGVNRNSLPTYLADQMDGVEDVTSADGGINIEKALTLNPDLIIAIGGNRNGDWNRENCELYGQAVTTFCYEQNYTYVEDIVQNLNIIAEVLGVEERAQQIVNDYEARVAQLRARVEAAGLGNRPVSVLRIMQGANYWLVWGTSESIAFRALGIARPEGQQDPEGFGAEISIENLILLNDADTLFLYVDDNATADVESVTGSAVWQSLEPVKNGRVHTVNSGIWNSIDILGLMRILDDIEAMFIAPAE